MTYDNTKENESFSNSDTKKNDKLSIKKARELFEKRIHKFANEKI